MRQVKKYHPHNPKDTRAGAKLQSDYNRQLTKESGQNEQKNPASKLEGQFKNPSFLQVFTLFLVATQQQLHIPVQPSITTPQFG